VRAASVESHLAVLEHGGKCHMARAMGGWRREIILIIVACRCELQRLSPYCPIR
jgi:hypothetical protein